jgi:hypothetical protein
MRRDAHATGLAVDLTAADGEDIKGLAGFDEHAGALEHLERGVAHVVHVVDGQDIEQHALAP